MKRKTPQIKGCIEVTSDQARGNAEAMVRRFCKKVKRSGILEEFRERRHYKKPTTRRAEQKRNRKRTIEKINRQRTSLYNMDRRVLKRRK